MSNSSSLLIHLVPSISAPKATTPHQVGYKITQLTKEERMERASGVTMQI
jgi:hypothetical protein